MGIYENIKALCDARGTSIKQLEKELGFSNGSLKKGTPNADRLRAVAQYFGVPMETFFDDYVESHTEKTYTHEELTPKADYFIKLLEDKDLYLLVERIINSSEAEREKFVQIGKLMGLIK